MTSPKFTRSIKYINISDYARSLSMVANHITIILFDACREQLMLENLEESEAPNKTLPTHHPGVVVILYSVNLGKLAVEVHPKDP